MILGTAGHIDHGKTTLVRALTGVDTDRLPEEKRRGITIELGFAPLEIEGVGTVGVVDVPGHEAFVRTMVAGATGIDLALVVVAADEGVMPQTREHLAILQLLGISRGVVALTKADLVDDEWLALVEEDVRTATAAIFPDAPIIPTSATEGRGLIELRAALREASRELPARLDDDLFRLPVDRAFTIKGTGTVVTGTVWSGRLRRDDTVRILPGDKTARVRSIQGHGAAVDVATPGSRAAIALTGLDVADCPRGATLVTDREWHATSLVRADLTLVSDAEVEIRPRSWFRIHVGTSEVAGRIVTKESPEPGVPFGARVVLDAPIVVRAGDRFVVRTTAPLNTIAGGVVVDPYPPRRARVWPANLDVVARLDRIIDESASEGVRVADLPVRLGLRAAACRDLLESRQRELVVVNGRLAARKTLDALRAAARALVEAHHREHPLEAGVPVQLLRSKVGGSLDFAVAAIDAEVAAGSLTAASGVVALPGWEASPSPGQATLLETLVSQLEAAGAEPPSVEELASKFGGDVEAILRFVERQGRVVQVEQNRYYTVGSLNLLVDRLRVAMAGGGELGPAELREALGLSRKYLIPFLEYCDRAGYTNRNAAGRVWRGA
jgi:selenocysteine-specific elongation factor